MRKYTCVRPQGLNVWPADSCVSALTIPPISHVSMMYFIPHLFISANIKMSIWDTKRIQMKKLSTTNLLNSSRPTTLVFVIFPSKVVCTIQKIWISKFECFKQNSGTINGFKWKGHQLQSCRSHRGSQLLYKVCFHLTLFEKVMNLFIVQHCYHHRIIQQTGGENVFTAGSYGEAAVMRSTSSLLVGGANRLWWWIITVNW